VAGCRWVAGGVACLGPARSTLDRATTQCTTLNHDCEGARAVAEDIVVVELWISMFFFLYQLLAFPRSPLTRPNTPRCPLALFYRTATRSPRFSPSYRITLRFVGGQVKGGIGTPCMVNPPISTHRDLELGHASYLEISWPALYKR
jgi:hypothetical protein